jgi:hypothetical protein
MSRTYPKSGEEPVILAFNLAAAQEFREVLGQLELGQPLDKAHQELLTIIRHRLLGLVMTAEIRTDVWQRALSDPPSAPESEKRPGWSPSHRGGPAGRW